MHGKYFQNFKFWKHFPNDHNVFFHSIVSSTTTAASNKTSEVEIEFCKSYISSSTAESSSDTASSFQFTSEPYYFSQMPNLTKTIINNLLIESKFYVPNNLSSSSSSPLSFEQIQNNPFDDYNHSMMMINNNDYNGNITDLNNNNDGYLNPNLKITLIVLLSLMIVFTVIGNILVCLSVILVRKLRHPSNYLLVSLAISDLCVAILVMPLALQYELSQSWRLSQNICDLWVSFDVTACTSSILNLCTISIDRYLAIKKPLTYGVRRTTRRILSFIVTVWIASCLISIPPVLILGNEHGTPEQPICEVSQNRGYQLYATLGSFYIPLFVMIVMYYKIYVAAKRVVDAELRDQRPSSCTNQTSSLTLKSSMGKTRKTLSFKSSNRFYSIRKQSPSSTTTTTTAKQQQQQQLQQQQQINYFDPSMKKPSTTTTTVQLLDKNQNYLLKQNDKTNHIRMKKKRKKRGQKFFRKYCCCCCGNNSCCCGCHCCQNSDYFDCGNDDDELSRQQNSNEIPVTTSTIITPAAIMVNSDGKTTTTSTTMLTVLTTPISTTTTSNDNHKHLNGHQKLGKKTLKQSPSPTTTTTTNFQSGFRRNRRRSFNNNTNTGSVLNNDGGTVLISGSGCSTTLAMKQRASNALRERKASVTLGIIMTAFTVCWLPFFILAVLRPFSASVMQIPRYVTSIALWLGYVNSMLNPIIYVTFHQDFRRAFKYLLCFQCRSMGTRLREEAYLSQYEI
ncbi:5-hydroxytryptamine receptor 7 [Dermatophagoides pteronyssinus]|uniref:5-hydroxytryptamine receptor 7 n=1 Tax=Dermatophagoides pteronyssinus TaxID=6956 RepID=A0ABQ8J4B9_DERPT|nr:5-hydroxytryptamine receptor 7 [Dermatophagoides pteronyssinus]